MQMNCELFCLLVLSLTYTYLVEKKELRFADCSNEGKKQHIAFCTKTVAFCNKKPDAFCNKFLFCNKLLSHFAIISIVFCNKVSQ